MSIHAEMLQLIQKLHDATVAGKLNWKQGVKENVFQVSFPATTVIISYRWVNTSGDEYDVSILNEEGKVVDAASSDDPDAENWFTVFDEIYTVARRKALGADVAVKRIADELDDLLNDDVPS